MKINGTSAEKTGLCGTFLHKAVQGGERRKKGCKLLISLQPFDFGLEAASGFEPENRGFADRCLTTWLCRHNAGQRLEAGGNGQINNEKMERETGFEPATSTLARLHSTAELFPLNYMIAKIF